MLDYGTILFFADYVYTYSLHARTMVFFHWSACLLLQSIWTLPCYLKPKVGAYDWPTRDCNYIHSLVFACIVQRCLQFHQHDTVWLAKQQILSTLAKVPASTSSSDQFLSHVSMQCMLIRAIVTTFLSVCLSVCPMLILCLNEWTFCDTFLTIW